MSSTDTPAYPRIAIIGGGLSGLTLLLTLHNRSIPATLYEREASFSSRAHLGGTLDLGYDSGQRALRANGLAALFAQHSRPEADTSRFADSQKVLGSMDADADFDLAEGLSMCVWAWASRGGVLKSVRSASSPLSPSSCDTCVRAGFPGTGEYPTIK